ncbi:MAG: ComEA family DNA-binding protein [Oscillospiraceae bacterium]|nr:ComEA family DNA-binding protein [Oscillospiraceae bacterium]
MDKAKITKMLVGLVVLAAVFSAGLYFGRTGGPGGFHVTTQYEIGAVQPGELEALADQLAARVEGERPREGAEAPTAPRPDVPVAEADGRININTASAEELTRLPGVGPAIAGRIVEHRETHGPFRIIEEITDVSGIGSARFADIEHLITVE